MSNVPVLPKNGLFTEPILIPLNPTVFQLIVGDEIGLNSGVYGSGFGALSFQFTSSHPSVIAVPQEPVVMDTGSDMYSFSYTMSPSIQAVGVGKATITVTMNGQTQAATVEVFDKKVKPIVTVISMQPGVQAAKEGGGFINLSSVPQDTSVQTSSSNTSVIEVHPSVHFVAGEHTLSAWFGMRCLAEGNATITASLNGSSASSFIQVVGAPFFLKSVSPLTLNLKVGETASVTVTFSKPAPADLVLHNWNDPNGGFSAPAKVPVAEGAQSVTFDVKGVFAQTAYGLDCSYSRQTLVVAVNIC